MTSAAMAEEYAQARGGVHTLLRLARMRTNAAVAFSALRGVDGTFAIAAYPDPGSPAHGGTEDAVRAPSASGCVGRWDLATLRRLAEDAWADPGVSVGNRLQRCVPYPLEPSTGDEPEILVQAVPLHDPVAPERPWGLLAVAHDPAARGQDGGVLDDLDDLARRLARYLRARERVLNGHGYPPDRSPPAPLQEQEQLDACRQNPAVSEGPEVLDAAAPEAFPGPQRRESLASLAIRGSAYIFGREAIGMMVRLAGVVITIRVIGPAAYGVYSGAAAFVMVVALLAQMGTEVYLIRLPGELDRTRYDQAYTFLLCTSALATGVSLAATFVLAPFLRPVGVVTPLRVLLLSVPINVLWAPGQASIERRFGYRQMGILELGGDVMLYATAVPLAILHLGAWSLVAGYFAWQSWLLVGSLLFSGLRPRWRWSLPAMREHCRHGFSFSASAWGGRLVGVINAMVVGTFVGPAGVGFVAFAQNLVTTIGFGAKGAYRLGLVALSKVSDRERKRLRYAIEEGTALQLLALAVPLAGFGVVARWLVPALFGSKWNDAIPVYCLIALATLLNAPRLIHATFMYSRGQNLRVAVLGAINAVVLAGTSVVLVEQFGVVGFGIAYLLSLVGTVYSDHVVRKVTDFDYRTFATFAVVLSPPILFPLAPMPYALALLAPLALLVLVPAMRDETLRLGQVIVGSLRRSPA